MNEQQAVAKKLARMRRELDEVAEQLDRISRSLAEPTPVLAGDQLVGATEIAEMLGVKPTHVTVWVSRGKLPPPVAELACGRIWRKADIEAWMSTRAAA